MANTTNPYCAVLGIAVPSVETAKDAPDANYYSLLIVALLERGQPMTLPEVAERLEKAGVAPRRSALASLKRCKPGRAPVYRDGDLYSLDPYDDETDLWAFRLGLRPPKTASLRVVRDAPVPLPDPDSAITLAQLEEAWRDGVPSSFSAQRIALCVLDAHGRAMAPADVIAFVAARGRPTVLSVDSAKYWRRGAPIHVNDDGLWELDPQHRALRSARLSIRERIEAARRRRDEAFDPAVFEARRKRLESKRTAHAQALARMRRVLIHPFPAKRPETITLVDVNKRKINTYVGDQEIASAVQELANYEIIAAVGVRSLLRTLGFDPGDRRLGELGPPQKTMAVRPRGRALKITTSLLVQGSCGIRQPFGDVKKLSEYLRRGQLVKLRRRLEADAKSLFALYQYGRLHRSVRLPWPFCDRYLPAPWVHRDEPVIYDLMAQACERGVPLEVVLGPAPDWDDPWSRVERVYVEKEEPGWRRWLVDEHGCVIDEDDVQLAR